MSAAWKCFTVNSDKDVAARCNVCHARDGTGKVQYQRPHRTFEKNTCL